jgi:hypothetical protein
MKIMRTWARLLSVSITALSFSSPVIAQQQNTTETIVFVRHGEKPDGGLGQLTCQGLNRALALRAVIDKTFGKPTAIFAPNPSDRKQDRGEPYHYIRPLATIEPTAIFYGMPVDTSIGVSNHKPLQDVLNRHAYHSGLVLVAWEHHQIVALARDLMTANGGDATTVPRWADDDFDSIYVVKVVRGGPGSKPHASFSLDHEGLDKQSTTCPG